MAWLTVRLRISGVEQQQIVDYTLSGIRTCIKCKRKRGWAERVFI